MKVQCKGKDDDVLHDRRAAAIAVDTRQLEPPVDVPVIDPRFSRRARASNVVSSVSECSDGRWYYLVFLDLDLVVGGRWRQNSSTLLERLSVRH